MARHYIIEDDGPDRVPTRVSFEETTRRAVAEGEDHDGVFGELLACLGSIEYTGGESSDERQGATYRAISAVGREVGMSDSRRRRWMRLCKDLGLYQKHIGHMFAHLKDAE